MSPHLFEDLPHETIFLSKFSRKEKLTTDLSLSIFQGYILSTPLLVLSECAFADHVLFGFVHYNNLQDEVVDLNDGDVGWGDVDLEN